MNAPKNPPRLRVWTEEPLHPDSNEPATPEQYRRTIPIAEPVEMPAYNRSSLAYRPDPETPLPTISEIWTETVQPDLIRQVAVGRVARDRLVQYRTAADRWAEFWRTLPPAYMAGGTTCEPPAPTTGKTVRAFMDWARATFGLTERTVEKYKTCLQGIVREGFDEDLGFPRVKSRGHVPKSHKTDLTAEAWAKLYDACEIARWPNPATASTFWRATLVLFAHYGFRTQELIAYDSRKRPLQWSDVHWDPEIPLKGCRTESPTGWLSYVPDKQSADKPEPLILPMTASVVSHLRAIQPDDTTGPVFPIPFSRKSLDSQWSAITAAAGLADWAGFDKLLIKHLRSSCATWHEKIRSGMGETVLGHAARGVSWRNYVQRAGMLVEQFRQFAELLPPNMQHARESEQLRLF